MDLNRKRTIHLPVKITKKIDKISAKLHLSIFKKVILVLFVITTLIGFGLFIFSITRHITTAKVISFDDHKALIQIGEYNSDPITTEITINEHFNYQKGDIIYINDNNKNIYYNLTPKINNKINIIGCILMVAPFIICCSIVFAILIIITLFFLLIMLPSTLIKQNKLYIIPIICVFIGLLILCLFASGEHANTWIAIGDSLILIPFLAACFLSIKKRK